MNGQDAIRKLGNLRNNQRVRKGMFVLPSLFTVGNIAAGYYAITQTLVYSGRTEDPRLDFAAKAIGLAILLDGFDGRIARATNTGTAFGKELDSLADAIAFGVAPAMLAYVWGFRYIQDPLNDITDTNPDFISKLVQFGAILTFLFLVAGVSRLARFNITVNPQPSNPGRPDRKYFVGMAIPAGAGVIASIVHFLKGQPINEWYWSVAWGVLLFFIGYLMVSTWRYPSFKEFTLMNQKNFRAIILVAAIITGIYFFSGPVLLILGLGYAFSGIYMRMQYWVRRPSAKPPKSKTQVQ